MKKPRPKFCVGEVVHIVTKSLHTHRLEITAMKYYHRGLARDSTYCGWAYRTPNDAKEDGWWPEGALHKLPPHIATVSCQQFMEAL